LVKLEFLDLLVVGLVDLGKGEVVALDFGDYGFLLK
jgi:hypothetical protein